MRLPNLPLLKYLLGIRGKLLILKANVPEPHGLILSMTLIHGECLISWNVEEVVELDIKRHLDRYLNRQCMDRHGPNASKWD